MRRMTAAETTGSVPDAMRDHLFPISELKPDPRNARKHDERNLQAIADSLEQFGWRSVIVARQSDKLVLAGHGRMLAALELGWTHAPVVFVEATDAQARAYQIADNRTSELATWDWSELTKTLAELTSGDVPPIGFDVDEIAELLAVPDPQQPAPERAKQGDDFDADQVPDYDEAADTKAIKVLGIPQDRSAEVVEHAKDMLAQLGLQLDVILY